jgi:hypothetical protein
MVVKLRVQFHGRYEDQARELADLAINDGDFIAGIVDQALSPAACSWRVVREAAARSF